MCPKEVTLDCSSVAGATYPLTVQASPSEWGPTTLAIELDGSPLGSWSVPGPVHDQETKAFENAYCLWPQIIPPPPHCCCAVHYSDLPPAPLVLTLSVGLHLMTATVADAEAAGPCGIDTCSTLFIITAGPACDSDGDGVLNNVDNCPSFNPDQTDTDGDGLGDACDDDIDNDGCKNEVDQHPKESEVLTGWVHGDCCGGPRNTFEGEDSDHDGLLNCEDPDDDNDGIPDDQDPCPIDVGQSCTSPVFCPCPPWYLSCLQGGCGSYMVVIVDPEDRDPRHGVIFDKFRIVGQRLYLFPRAGEDLEQSAKAIATGRSHIGAQGKRRTDRKGLLRMEIWARNPQGGVGQYAGLVATYSPDEVKLRQVSKGTVLMVEPAGPRGLIMGAVPAVGASVDRYDAHSRGKP
jgi:thrombospondin type 3 repeat protein